MKYTVLHGAYKFLLKPILFLFDPERVHDAFTFFGKGLGRFVWTRWLVASLLVFRHPALEQTVCGVKFNNPVGLSAGFDKDANLQQILPDVGFGFMEVGSVTLNSYKGNPVPRLYRLQKSLGLVVYYGLKNLGAAAIIQKLQKSLLRFPIGVSIAKTNAEYTASLEAGIQDYKACLEQFAAAGIGDFYTINISCPNTFGGEPFTTTERLQALLTELDKDKVSKPIFVKVPINIPWVDFKDLLDVILQHKVQGVVIGNLTKIRDPKLIKDEIPAHVQGGISGIPTQQLCNELISQTYQYCGDSLKIVGVGGIFSANDAYEKIRRGASLLQLITGMIFEGPQLIGEINRGLVELLQRDGYESISEAVGAYYEDNN